MRTNSMAKRALMAVVAVMTIVASTAAVQLSDVEVVLKSQNTIGTRPDGSTVLIDIKLEVAGSPAGLLTGTGRHFGSGGTHAYWDVSRQIDGNIMTLVGTVQDTNNPLYLGSPILVIAELETQWVTFAFGPLPGGPFEGHTVVTQGPGRIQIKN